jgi:hypothetical protein
LRVYLAEGDGLPIEVQPAPFPRKYWTRRGVAEWLVEQLGQHRPTPIDRRSSQIDPLRSFKFVPMDGRNAQIPVVHRRLVERVISTRC